jgi:ABC-type lipoprotein export system ATPase subunit
LAPAPRVLLADEPTAHLDRVTGRLVISLLKDAAADGTTVVAATHDRDLVAAADSRLLLTGSYPQAPRADAATDEAGGMADEGL